jgi:hypothetical protein
VSSQSRLDGLCSAFVTTPRLLQLLRAATGHGLPMWAMLITREERPGADACAAGHYLVKLFHCYSDPYSRSIPEVRSSPLRMAASVSRPRGFVGLQ